MVVVPLLRKMVSPFSTSEAAILPINLFSSANIWGAMLVFSFQLKMLAQHGPPTGALDQSIIFHPFQVRGGW